jgi:hypothetical protein
MLAKAKAEKGKEPKSSNRIEFPATKAMTIIQVFDKMKRGNYSVSTKLI